VTENNTEHASQRDVDLLWQEGVRPLREQITGVAGDIKSLRESVKTDLKGLADNMSSVRRLIVTIIVTSVPAYVSAIVAFFELKK
jgi:hypothetical protein